MSLNQSLSAISLGSYVTGATCFSAAICHSAPSFINNKREHSPKKAVRAEQYFTYGLASVFLGIAVDMLNIGLKKLGK
jgi:hypothetical protein